MLTLVPGNAAARFPEKRGPIATTSGLSHTAVHEGAEPDQESLFCPSFLILRSASYTKARASEAPGSTSGDARRRLGVDAGGERRILLEDAYVVLRVPITAVGSVTLPWAASHSFVDLRT